MQREEFEEVYAELYPRLLAYARTQLDHAASYDVVAATFETLWKRDLPHPGDDEGLQRRVRSLAFEVLKGHVSNEYRSRRRRSALWHRLASQYGGREPEVDSDVEVDDAARIGYWLSHLSEGDRHVIALFNAGHSLREMAEILGCTVTAAARRRDRAKERLRRIVDGDGGEP